MAEPGGAAGGPRVSPDRDPGERLDADSLVIGVHCSFDELRGAWERLEDNGDCYAFQRRCWIGLWHELAGATVEPCLVLVERPDASPLMLLPLGIERRLGAACLVWLGGAFADYQGPLLDAGCMRQLGRDGFAVLWRRILAALPPLDALVLERQPERIGSQPNPFASAACELHPSNAHFTELHGPLDDFVRAKRSTRWASNERRKERRLAEHGRLRFVVAATADEAARLLPEMIRQKSRRYAELGVPDLFAEDLHREFLHRLSERHVGDGFVYLCALLVGERVAATFWGLVYRGRFYHLLPTYARDELTRYSPGNVLLRHMFDWCLDNRIGLFDFTIGDEPYKELWCDRRMALYDCYRGLGPRGLPVALLGRWRTRLKRAIKRSPFLWRQVQKLRARGAG